MLQKNKSYCCNKGIYHLPLAEAVCKVKLFIIAEIIEAEEEFAHSKHFLLCKNGFKSCLLHIRLKWEMVKLVHYRTCLSRVHQDKGKQRGYISKR